MITARYINNFKSKKIKLHKFTNKKIVNLAKKNFCVNINFMRDYTGTPRNQTLV